VYKHCINGSIAVQPPLETVKHRTGVIDYLRGARFVG